MNLGSGKIGKILIVGLGSIGARHLRLARELYPDADIRVLRHSGFADTPELADACVSDMAAALAFRPDVAVIANPAPFHVASALPLAEAGVHLMIEKPIAADSAGLDELLEVISRRQIVAMVGYNLRQLPSLQVFREKIASGLIGRVRSVRAEIGQFLPSWRPGSDYRKGVSAQSALGGGVLLELSHEIDYLSWIFGRAGWVQATLSRQSDLEIDVEDSAHLVLGLGETGLTARLDLDFIRHDTSRQCFAIGERGTLRWDGMVGAVDLYSAETKEWQNICSLPSQRDDAYLAEWRHLAECIAGGSTPLVSAADAVATLEVIDAARRSAQDLGRRITVNRCEMP
jgi:predicted dehydrogenase